MEQVEKRYKVRRVLILASGAIAGVLIGVGVAWLIWGGSGNKVNSEVTTTTVLVTTTTLPAETTLPPTTIPPTTSTTIPYQNLVFDENGSGLPLGVSILNSGDTYSTSKVGDRELYEVSDSKGVMLWIVEVTEPRYANAPQQNKVLTSFSMPVNTDTDEMCLDWCYFNGVQDSSIVAIFNSNTEQVKVAYTVDTAKLTLTGRKTDGITPYPPNAPAPYDPARPELYSVVALTNSEDAQWYAQNELVTISGAASGSTSVGDMKVVLERDGALGKDIAVLVKDGKALDMVSVDQVEGAQMYVQFSGEGGTYAYKGDKKVTLVGYVKDNKFLDAWRVDEAGGKFVAVDTSDVS